MEEGLQGDSRQSINQKEETQKNAINYVCDNAVLKMALQGSL